MTISHPQTVALPNLKIVPTNTIQPHEDEDIQRAMPLVESLKRDRELRNPIIVTPLEYGMGYLLLDGTNRFTAFRQLGIPHMLVQVVPYEPPAVELASWNHIVGNTTQEAFMDTIQQFDDDDFHFNEGFHGDGKAIARITFADSTRVITITATEPSLAKQVDYLRRIVNAYMKVGRLNRTTSDDMSELQNSYPDILNLIEFISLTPKAIQELTHEGQKVPAGITRHIIQGRALRLNYDLSLLTTDEDLDEKNAYLHDWVAKKFADRNVRLYTEATYQFED